MYVAMRKMRERTVNAAKMNDIGLRNAIRLQVFEANKHA